MRILWVVPRYGRGIAGRRRDAGAGAGDALRGDGLERRGRHDLRARPRDLGRRAARGHDASRTASTVHRFPVGPRDGAPLRRPARRDPLRAGRLRRRARVAREQRLVARACRSSSRTTTATTCACCRPTCSAPRSGAPRRRPSAAPCCPACTTSPTRACATVRARAGRRARGPLQRPRRGAAGPAHRPGARRRRGGDGLRPARRARRGRRPRPLRDLGPYLVYAGRLEEGKRVQVAVEHVVRLAAERPDAPALVLMGRGGYRPPPAARGRVVELGYVSEEEKRAVYAGAVALVNPSEMESLSIVLMEAWLEGTPAIVAAGSEVMSDHVARSGGGMTFAVLRRVPRRGGAAAGRPRRARAHGRPRGAPTPSRSTAGPRCRSAWRPSPSGSPPDAGAPAHRGRRARRRRHRPGPGLARSCAAGAPTARSSPSTSTPSSRGRCGGWARAAGDLEGADALVLHYSVWSRAVEAALASGAPLGVCYHNVTPGSLIRAYNPGLADACDRARAELPRLRGRAAALVADSRFNALELREAGRGRGPRGAADPRRPARAAPRRARPARRPRSSRWGGSCPTSASTTSCGPSPSTARHRAPDATLTLVGSDGGFEGYRRALEDLVGADRRRRGALRRPGLATPSATGVYARADAYLCMSEHEGFCAPAGRGARARGAGGRPPRGRRPGDARRRGPAGRRARPAAAGGRGPARGGLVARRPAPALAAAAARRHAELRPEAIVPGLRTALSPLLGA